MTPDEFRTAGHELIEWIASYRESIGEHPVRSNVEPHWVERQMTAAPPASPDTIDAVIADLDNVVVPGMTHWQHPDFFAWFPSNSSLSSVLGDLVASGLGGLGLSWEAGPALTEIEEGVCGWFADILGLEAPWKGSIQDTASMGCFLAMIAAREHASNMSMHRGGLAGLESPLVVYVGATANTSVQRAVMVAGYGADNVRSVTLTPDHAVDPAAVREAIEADVAAGHTPAAIVATIGTTGVTAVDPVPQLADLAEEFGLWLHVDAAMAGSAAILPEFADMFAGIQLADSISLNPHKWLGTSFDCSLLFVNDPRRLTGVMSIDSSYIPAAADTEFGDETTQYRDWSIALGRRFRGMKLWLHLRLDGLDAIRARLRRDIDHARTLGAWVERHPEWELLAPVLLQTVCVRHVPPGMSDVEVDRHTEDWVERLNASGKALVTKDSLGGRPMVRLSIGSEATDTAAIERLWENLRWVVA